MACKAQMDLKSKLEALRGDLQVLVKEENTKLTQLGLRWNLP